MTTVSKNFSLEMAHRLPSHGGLCKNIHGHSYKIRLTIEGDVSQDKNMVIDYSDLTAIANTVFAKYDHSFLVEQNDTIMLNFLRQNDLRHVLLEKPSTAENLCQIFADELITKIKTHNNIHNLKIRVYETNNTYAEKQYNLINQ